MNKIEDVCALIVTYNRKRYLMKLIEGILSGDVIPKKILIFDNHSTDNTAEELIENKIITEYKEAEITKSITNENIEIYYYRNNTNSGGAGGFHDGIAIAEKINCKYIWTMDDDVLPDKNCLERLIKALKKGYRICIPNRTDENYIDRANIKLNMSNPFFYNITLREKSVLGNKIKEEIIDVVDMPFEGPIFETKIVKAVGLPKKEFFIIFDDSEFAYRISKTTKIGFVKSAILHKQIIPKKNKTKQIMNWKNYYGLRNQYWFDINYGENWGVKKIRPLISKFIIILKAILKRKWQNIKVVNAAYYDGTHNRLGKIVEPQEEFKWNK